MPDPEPNQNLPAKAPAAPKKASRLLLALVILASCMVTDQLTKKWAHDHLKQTLEERQLDGDKIYRYWGDTIRIQYAENTGAFLGWGNNFQPRTRFLLLTLATGLFLGAMAVYAVMRWDMELSKFLGVQMILAGGLGNLVDRVLYEGTVIDFMNMGIGGLRTGIFNVADVGITSGAILLLILSFKRPPRSEAEARGAEPESV